MKKLSIQNLLKKVLGYKCNIQEDYLKVVLQIFLKYEYKNNSEQKEKL